MPVTAPALNAIFNPWAKPLDAAWAVLTFALTDIIIPIYPAAPDKIAPIRYPPTTQMFPKGDKKSNTQIIAPTIPMVVYCLFK